MKDKVCAAVFVPLCRFVKICDLKFWEKKKRAQRRTNDLRSFVSKAHKRSQMNFGIAPLPTYESLPRGSSINSVIVAILLLLRFIERIERGCRMHTKRL